MLEFLSASSLVLHFSYCTLITFLMMLSAYLELASELESDLWDTVGWVRKWLVDFNTLKPQLVSFDGSNNTGVLDVKMDGSVLEEKSPFKILELSFSSKLDWGCDIISFAEIASNKIGALILSMKFLSPEVALYHYKFILLHEILFSCLGCCYF